MVIDFKEPDPELEFVGGLKYFGEVELKSLHIPDLLQVNQRSKVPAVLFFHK